MRTSDDYFSEAAIKARVDARMQRFRRLFMHIPLVFLGILVVLILALEGTLTPVAAVAMGGLIFISLIVHAMMFVQSAIREDFTEKEMERASQDKTKHERLTLGEDGELVAYEDAPTQAEDDSDVFYQDDQSDR